MDHGNLDRGRRSRPGSPHRRPPVVVANPQPGFRLAAVPRYRVAGPGLLIGPDRPDSQVTIYGCSTDVELQETPRGSSTGSRRPGPMLNRIGHPDALVQEHLVVVRHRGQAVFTGRRQERSKLLGRPDALRLAGDTRRVGGIVNVPDDKTPAHRIAERLVQQHVDVADALGLEPADESVWWPAAIWVAGGPPGGPTLGTPGWRGNAATRTGCPCRSVCRCQG
jgi:hypothetical protein